jgi:hypothetical protein
MASADMVAAMAEMDLSTIPLATNPSGAPPNFTNPPSMAGTVFAVGLALSLISTVFVSLRLYTNWTNAKRLVLADCTFVRTIYRVQLTLFPDLCTFALIFLISYYALIASGKIKSSELQNDVLTLMQLASRRDIHGMSQ